MDFLCQLNIIFLRTLLIIIFLTNLNLHGQLNPNGWDTAWVSSFGGKDDEMGVDIKETFDKGFILVGTTNTFGNGNNSFYVVKTDSLGKFDWSKSLGTGANDIAYSVETTTDSGFVFIGTSNWSNASGYDGYIIKTDKKGNQIWTKNYGGSDWDFLYNSCSMPDGGYVLCGETFSNSQNGSDFFLVRINSNGDTLWTKQFGGPGNNILYSVEQKFNRIYVVGKSFDLSDNFYKACIYKLDFTGNILSQKTFTSVNQVNSTYNDLFLTDSGHILLCGTISTSLYSNYIMHKLDTFDLAEVFFTTINQDVKLRSIIEGYSKDIYTIGQSSGGLGGKSALFFRFDSISNYLNSADFGGIYDEDPYEIIKTSKGYAFIGSTNSYGNLNASTTQNMYLVVFNKKGLVNNYFLIVSENQDSLSPVGIHSFNSEQQKIKLYPNPIQENYQISFTNTTTQSHDIFYEIYNTQGLLVNREVLSTKSNVAYLSKGTIESGIYFYRLISDSKIIATGKLTFE